MDFKKLYSKLNPEAFLRVGFGAMYLYSSIDIIRHPANWEWAVKTLPGFIQTPIVNVMGLNGFLFWHGVGELVLALVFLSWFLPRIFLRFAAFFAFLEMASILVFIGIDLITFRDIGLLGGMAALLVMSFRQVDLQV